MTEIRKWLGAIGLSQYADDFEANDIDMDRVKQVDDQLLKDIGVARAGHRLRIRNAIAKLVPTLATKVNLSGTITAPETTAARRLIAGLPKASTLRSCGMPKRSWRDACISSRAGYPQYRCRLPANQGLL